ncbi:MAG TPA: 5-formyltetrahydrofolate cyclo-ligase [Symbiobacteriaceae bacterium]|jgi:5-formyltetrahydrofolate cyclo-ligase
MAKAELRRAMIERRMGLPAAERMALSRAAQAWVVGSGAFIRARLVLLYEPFRAEAETGLIAAAARAQGKRLALPRVVRQPRGLVLHLWQGEPAAGAYGIREPDPTWPQVAPGEVDLAVVPGTAFDPSGRRLGYGGGYYDRLLPEIRASNPDAVFIGLAYPFQMVPALPAESHDVPLDGVATAVGLVPAGRP